MNISESRRVLFINTTCGVGSTGRIVTGLYRKLEEQGYTCMVAYGREDAPEGFNAYRIGSDFDVNLHGVISRLTDRHALYSVAATRKLIEKIEEFDPHIIHLHNLHGYYLNIKLLFRYIKKSGKKIIWTLHDCWSFTGHCTHFEYIMCNKWKQECNNCEQLREYPKSVWMDASKKNYRLKKELFTGIPQMRLVTPSAWLQNKVSMSFMKDYPCEVIPTGIALEDFRPVESTLREKFGIGQKKVILGAASPWRERKGLEEFKKLAKIAGDHYQIVMVGLNEKQKKELPESIIGLPRTNSVDEMVELYSMADVYINLTLEDTFPTTNIEALACGTPVITYRAGGSPESITKETGYIVERGNIQGVLAATDILTKGKDSREECLKRAKEYDKEKRFSEYYEKIYCEFEEKDRNL